MAIPADPGIYVSAADVIRALEDWQHTKMGEEQRLQWIGAGAGGLMDGVVAVVVRFLWGG